MTELGIVLIIVGAPLFVFGLFRISNIRHVSAKNYSVAVGRDNNAPINVSNVSHPVHSPGDVFWKIWAIITGITTFVGLAIQLWGGK